MSFFKNPQYNSIKVLLLVVLISGSGYFIFSNNDSRGTDQTGKIFFNKKDKNENTDTGSRKIIVWGNTGECTVVYTNGTWADGTSTYANDGSFAGCLLSNGTLVTPGMVGIEDIIEHNGPKSLDVININIK